MWHSGDSVANILRMFYASSPQQTPPSTLMLMCVDVFGGSYDSIRIIGGWWVDGTAEIDDIALEQYLAPKIAELVPRQQSA